MKIALTCEHWGLIDLMFGVLKNHDVRLHEKWENRPVQDGTEDIIISTFSYQDLAKYKGDKPLIVYATDPVPLFMLDKFKELQSNPKVTFIMAEDCYPNKVLPLPKNPVVIPFGLNKDDYSEYTGEINRVLVVNRKAESRWDEVIKGVTGLGMPLAKYLEDIPFEICDVPDKLSYRKFLPKYKVMFYFSNSPYTIVMFEGMTIGMPMVGFNHFNVFSNSPVEKYLKNYSTDQDEIRSMLEAELQKKHPQKEEYKFLPYEEIVKRWDQVLEVAVHA